MRLRSIYVASAVASVFLVSYTEDANAQPRPPEWLDNTPFDPGTWPDGENPTNFHGGGKVKVTASDESWYGFLDTNHGYFLRFGKEWKEYDKNGKHVYTFEQVEATKGHSLLYDKSRDIYVYLGARKANVRTGTTSEWNFLYHRVKADWIYKGGFFGKYGDDWYEFAGTDKLFKFKEVESSFENVVLHDPARNLFVRLLPKSTSIRHGKGKWEKLYDRRKK